MIGREPDGVLSNNVSSKLHVEPTLQGPAVYINHFLRETIEEGDLVTLHGYLKILPGDVLMTSGATFLNGHPGLITVYPELKGKNPQERFFKFQSERNYDFIGSVVHYVVRDVDNGPVLAQSYDLVPDTFKGKLKEPDVYRILRRTSLEAWMKALKGVLY